MTFPWQPRKRFSLLQVVPFASDFANLETDPENGRGDELIEHYFLAL